MVGETGMAYRRRGSRGRKASLWCGAGAGMRLKGGFVVCLLFANGKGGIL